jgi:hypothetical protein
MADLSPAAQAVLDAFGTYPLRASHVGEDLIPALGAALRAVVEHLSETHAGFDLADRYGCFVEADDILAIVEELEAATE